MKVSGGAKDSLSSVLLSASGQAIISQNPVTTSVTAASDSSDDYQVSGDSLWLDDAQNELSESSDIDMDKVESIKQALSQGNLDLDPKVLTQAILEMHRG